MVIARMITEGLIPKAQSVIAALRGLKVETGSLACLGCGHEHHCTTHGCAILRGAAELLEQLIEPAAGNERASNGDIIRAMTDEQLAHLIDLLHYGRDEPWSKQFKEQLCDRCPTIKVRSWDNHTVLYLNACDISDGKCPHGDEVLWWLKQPDTGK